MAKFNNPAINFLWEDRKHFLWFPFSFTKYRLSNERLYTEKGLLNTHYDEVLLYRIVDLCLNRTLAQKIFGTGTITLTCRADSESIIVLKNIKNSFEVKTMLSNAVENVRRSRHVVGKEFYSGSPHLDHSDTDYFDNNDDDTPGDGFIFDEH